MDGETFDYLSRRVSGARSRRGLMGALAALPVAAALLGLQEGTDAAKDDRGLTAVISHRGHEPGQLYR